MDASVDMKTSGIELMREYRLNIGYIISCVRPLRCPFYCNGLFQCLKS